MPERAATWSARARRRATQSADQTNVSALTVKPATGPNRATTRPARTGPATWALDWRKLIAPLAVWRAAVGTTRGRSETKAG